MASTYTPAGIELITDGEQSGTWGQTTNTNWELIEELATGVVSIALTGTTYTLTTTDGTSTEGRHAIIKFTGSPGGTCTVTVSPNDMQKIYWIVNTSDQTVTLTQGTGSNVSVLAGSKKVMYCDGAGAGAAVVDLSQDLDIAFGDGDKLTFGDSDDLEISHDGTNNILNSDNGDIKFQFTDTSSVEMTSTGVKTDQIDELTSAAGVTIDSVLLKDDVVNATDIETGSISANDGTASATIADSTGVMTIASSVLTTTDINGGTIDGVTLGTNSAVTEAQVDNININGNTISSTDTNGNITLAPDGTGVVALSSTDLTFGDNDKAIFGAGSDLQIYHDGSSNIIAGNVFFDGTDASTSISSPAAVSLKAGDANNEYSTLRFATSLDGSLAMIGAKATTTGAYPTSVGQLEFAVQNGMVSNTRLTIDSTGIDVTGTVTADGLTVDGVVNINASTSTMISFEHSIPDIPWTLGADSTGDFRVREDGTDRAYFISGGDFQLFEDTGTTAKFFWDASAESLGIGTDSPSAKLEVTDAIKVSKAVQLTPATSSYYTNDGSLSYYGTTNNVYLTGAASGGLMLAANGTRTCNITLGSSDNHIEFNTNSTQVMRIDSSGNVGIGTSSPDSPLTVRTGTATDTPDIRIEAYRPKIRFVDISASGDDAEIKMDGNALRFSISEEVDNDTPLTERMRIDSSGNVGIGTSSPDRHLHISNSTTAYLRLENTGPTLTVGEVIGEIEFEQQDSGGPDVGGSIGALADGANGETALFFKTSSSERMRIDSSGNLLVNTTTALGRITTQQWGGNTLPHLVLDNVRNDSFYGVGLQVNAGDNTSPIFARFKNTSGTTQGSIVGSGGTSVSYVTSSDYRLKENVVAMTGSIDRVKSLKPSRFNFIIEPNKTVDGFLAHEAAEVVPEAVTGEKDALDADGNPDYQGIDQSKLVPLLTSALQEAIAEIESLKARVAALEN